MLRYFLLLSLSLVLCGSGTAATFTVSGGSPADFTNYTPRHLSTPQLVLDDPWPNGGSVVNASISVAPNARIDIILRGGFDDGWALDFPTGVIFSGTVTPGERTNGIIGSDFLASFFSNEGSGVPLTHPTVAVQSFGRRLELGWDGAGISGESDLGYKRIIALIAPVPAPAGFHLLFGAFIALGALRFCRSEL